MNFKRGIFFHVPIYIFVPSSFCLSFFFSLSRFISLSLSHIDPTFTPCFCFDLLRGLPHCHILLWLKSGSIPIDRVDQYVSAEIPNPHLSPKHHNVLISQHLHECKVGRCKDDQEAKCVKHFPQPFCDQTHFAQGCSRVIVRRRAPDRGGETWLNFTNANVVEHSPFLAILFDCHVCVIIVTSVRTIKYLFKYVCKGNGMMQRNVMMQNSL